VTLDWQPPTTTPGGSIVGYRIYRSRLQGQETAYADTGSTAGTYHDSGTTPGQTYWYSVTAVYANGTESPRSNEASAIAR
jgi:alpha-glucosidase